MLSLRSSSSLFSRISRSLSQSTKNPPIIRWVALFPKEKQYLKYLKKHSFNSQYLTEINASLLNQNFGPHAYDDFFGLTATVDLTRLYSTSYEDLTDIEKRQRAAIRKELDYIIEKLNFRLDFGKAIHERNINQINYLINRHFGDAGNFRPWYERIFPKQTFGEYIANMPPALNNEITLI